MLKSVETSGFPNRAEIKLTVSERKVSVTNVSIDLNAPNGALTTNDTVSGVDLHQLRERLFVVSET